MEYLVILVLIERILDNKEVTATLLHVAVTSSQYMGANRLPIAPFSILSIPRCEQDCQGRRKAAFIFFRRCSLLGVRG